MADFMSLGATILAIIADGQVMSGMGMLGMGGALASGNAAKAGYHGSPGTITLPIQSLKHLLTPLATASRYLPLLPENAAHMGAFLMLLSSSGPSRQPGLPMAETDITFRSLNLACSFHMVCE